MTIIAAPVENDLKRPLSTHVRDLVEVMEIANSRELKAAALNEAIAMLQCVGLQFRVDELRERHPASCDESAGPQIPGVNAPAIDLEELRNINNNGPVWAGNVISHQAADDLVNQGLAIRCGEHNGYFVVTAEGFQVLQNTFVERSPGFFSNARQAVQAEVATNRVGRTPPKCGGFEDVFLGDIGVTGMCDGRLHLRGSPVAGVDMGCTPTGYVLRVGDHEVLAADSELRKWLPLLDRARRSPYPGPKVSEKP